MSSDLSVLNFQYFRLFKDIVFQSMATTKDENNNLKCSLTLTAEIKVVVFHTRYFFKPCVVRVC